MGHSCYQFPYHLKGKRHLMAVESRTNTVSRDYFVWYANDFLKLVVSDARCLLWPLYFIRQALDP
jgi:hypothetical protein